MNSRLRYKEITFCFVVLVNLAVSPACGIELTSMTIGKDNSDVLPLVINTWAFTNATEAAWQKIFKKGKTPVETVEAGCTKCEDEQCDFTVGYGGSPDEKGETTLDSMIMNGDTMNVGAVGGLRKVKNAVGVARHVLENTQHSILVGELASDFAHALGFKKQSLSTTKSYQVWKDWQRNYCQPNFWENVHPNPRKSCGPYKPVKSRVATSNEIPTEDFDLNGDNTKHASFSENSHDTICMIAINNKGSVAVGTSSNGANHKIPGRVGDAPIPGAGGYADGTVGAAAATGDGDVMMRFLPSFLAVEEMRRGATPTEAAEIAIKRIARYYPKFFGAIIAANVSGEYGAACNGMKEFPYSVVNPKLKNVTVNKIPCFNSI